jgi:DNA-binding SARP family transcriptional activator
VVPVVFSLNVLGGAVLQGRGGPVGGKAAHRRRLAVLAVLAVARRPVGRERLIGLLWPEHRGDAARHLLSESLYVLRKALGDDALVSAGDDVTLSARAVKSDVGEMETALEAGELERAVALYRGPFLEGFYVDDAPDFERWVEGERDRLARAYGRAVETLAERADADGRPVDAVEWWRLLSSHDPDSTRVAIRLVSALYAAGERAGALRAGAAHADFLREQEVEPSPEFLDLVARIRADCATTPW